MVLQIRPATYADESAVSHICLVTADAGRSAEALFKNKDLPGLVYALPYLHLSSTFQFVLVDVEEEGMTGENTTKDKVVGYVVGSTNCRTFEQDAAENWWPRVQARHPHPPSSKKGDYTDTEWAYFDTITHPPTTAQEVLDVYQAFLHVNILEPYRGKGWGSKLIRTAAETVKRGGGKGLWVAIDSRNDESRKFYLAVGFRKIASEQGEYYGLDVERFLAGGKGTTS
jgi:ribosomal protein S18 acetylase RimI-like enzyme